ncbi:hypothetical protein GCM10010302_02400 [Streptomyces polychromogenes]|uniref:Carboxypeptidase regulatory-like domain-containing protein n=1 Tax=Streptomyces polychromogenes TaxID=67342 RepID=A0ABN0UZS9_9ACTN
MYGHVRSISDDEPIAMIKVSVYRPDLTLIDHVYTDEDGYYAVAVAAGEPVAVRFDTHHSLVNAEKWQPSAVVGVITDDTVPLDRRLVPVGQFAETATGVDVLGGFLLASAVEEDAGYAVSAAARLAQIKTNTTLLQGVQNLLLRYFEGPRT